MRLAALLIFMGLLFAGCGKQGAAPGGKPPPAAPEVQWGEAVNGLQAGIAIKSPPAGPESRATLLLAVRNVGDKPVRIIDIASIIRVFQPQALEVKVGGQFCSWVGTVMKPSPLMAEQFTALAPGATQSIEFIFIPEYWGPKLPEPLKPPFKAEITFRYSWQQARVEAGSWKGKADDAGKLQPTIVDGLWTGDARSKPVQIEVPK